MSPRLKRLPTAPGPAVTLPSAAEWRLAAYTETRPSPPPPLGAGRTYAYPTENEPTGMNVRSSGPGRHLPVGQMRAGVNGLFDMGGNVWPDLDTAFY
jgi:formylglycine-generating enzyme required for sulfatase activity